MEKKAAELKKEVNRLLAQAEQADADEDALYGKGKHGDQLPKELQFRQSRLQKIQEAMQVLEEEACAEAEAQRPAYEAKKKAYDKKSGPSWSTSQSPFGKP